MSDITTANVVYVSSSKNGDYVEATPHDGAVRYIRADAPELVALVEAARSAIACFGYQHMPGNGVHPMAQSGIDQLNDAIAQWEALQ